jgi:hypothetical protein
VLGGHHKYFGKTMFFIDGKYRDQKHNDDCMARSEAKLHFRY